MQLFPYFEHYIGSISASAKNSLCLNSTFLSFRLFYQTLYINSTLLVIKCIYTFKIRFIFPFTYHKSNCYHAQFIVNATFFSSVFTLYIGNNFSELADASTVLLDIKVLNYSIKNSPRKFILISII